MAHTFNLGTEQAEAEECSRPAWLVYLVSFRPARLTRGWGRGVGAGMEKQFTAATLGGSQEAIIRVCAWELELNRVETYV